MKELVPKTKSSRLSRKLRRVLFRNRLISARRPNKFLPKVETRRSRGELPHGVLASVSEQSWRQILSQTLSKLRVFLRRTMNLPLAPATPRDCSRPCSQTGSQKKVSDQGRWPIQVPNCFVLDAACSSEFCHQLFQSRDRLKRIRKYGNSEVCRCQSHRSLPKVWATLSRRARTDSPSLPLTLS